MVLGGAFRVTDHFAPMRLLLLSTQQRGLCLLLMRQRGRPAWVVGYIGFD